MNIINSIFKTKQEKKQEFIPDDNWSFEYMFKYLKEKLVAKNSKKINKAAWQRFAYDAKKVLDEETIGVILEILLYEKAKKK